MLKTKLNNFVSKLSMKIYNMGFNIKVDPDLLKKEEKKKLARRTRLHHIEYERLLYNCRKHKNKSDITLRL